MPLISQIPILTTRGQNMLSNVQHLHFALRDTGQVNNVLTFSSLVLLIQNHQQPDRLSFLRSSWENNIVFCIIIAYTSSIQNTSSLVCETYTHPTNPYLYTPCSTSPAGSGQPYPAAPAAGRNKSPIETRETGDAWVWSRTITGIGVTSF